VSQSKRISRVGRACNIIFKNGGGWIACSRQCDMINLHQQQAASARVGEPRAEAAALLFQRQPAQISGLAAAEVLLSLALHERVRGIRRGAVLVVVLRNTKSISRVVRGGGLLAVDVVLIFSVALQSMSLLSLLCVRVSASAAAAADARRPLSFAAPPIHLIRQ
jgi:hypothetical protein